MYISDFFHFLYQGPTFLKLYPEISENDSRRMFEIENEPILFTKESDYKYSIIKDGASLLSIDSTTLNKVIKEWQNFSLLWVKGCGMTAIVLGAVSAYQVRASAVYFYPPWAGSLLASGLCLLTIHRIGQLNANGGSEAFTTLMDGCNSLRTQLFQEGLNIIDEDEQNSQLFDEILTIPETLFLLRRFLEEEFPDYLSSELHETMPDLVCLLDENRYPDEKDKTHCEELRQALSNATLINPILNAYASVGAYCIVDIYDSLYEIDPDEIEIPPLKSVIKEMLDGVQSDDIEETKAWFIQQVEATANEKLRESLK